MDKKHFITQLGHAIRIVRKARGETLASMSKKLNYKDESSYNKIEKGQLKSIDLCRLIEVCAVLKVSPYHLCNMAGVDLLSHPNSILTYNEFYTSLYTNTDEEIKYLLKLLPPPPEKIRIRYKLFIGINPFS